VKKNHWITVLVSKITELSEIFIKIDSKLTKSNIVFNFLE